MMISSNTTGRPLLKGVFHIIATLFYIKIFPYLLYNTPEELKICSILYLSSIIANFGTSSLFHFIPWSDRYILYIRRLDHIMIFYNIAATYYIAICTMMKDVHVIVPFFLVISLITGLIIRILFTEAPPKIIAAPYLLMGWSILLDPLIIVKSIIKFPIGSFIACLAGVFYTTGGIIYLKQYPCPCPGYLGHHELFHICTIIGSLLFTLCFFGYIIPSSVVIKNCSSSI